MKTLCEICEKPLTKAEQVEAVAIARRAPIPFEVAITIAPFLCTECIEKGPGHE